MTELDIAAIEVLPAPWARPKCEGHKVSRLIVSSDGQTVAWIGHGNDVIADKIAAAIMRFPALITEVTRLRAAIERKDTAVMAAAALREYAASVWFDEARATDEEHELMGNAKRSITAALADEKESGT